MTNFWFRLGKSSLEKAQEAASQLHKELGKVIPYLSPDVLNDPDMRFSFWILTVKENINYLKTRKGVEGTIKLAFMKAMIRSGRLALTESELDKYLEKSRDELELLGEEL